MNRDNREKLLKWAKESASGLHRIWVDVIRLEPDDCHLQTKARDGYSSITELIQALVSEPDKAAEGGRRCSFCGHQTEIPF